MNRSHVALVFSESLGWAFMAFVVVVPWIFIFVPGIDEHDSTRWAQVLLLGYLGLTLLPMSWHMPALHLGRRLLGAALLVLGSVAVSAHALHPVWAFREFALLLGLVILSMVLGRLPPKLWVAMSTAVVFAMAVYGLLLLLLVLASLSTGRWPEPGNLTLGYSNYRFFNHVQTIALPLVVGVGFSSNRRLLRGLAVVAAVLGVAFMWHAGARATAVALVSAAVVSALFLGVQGRRYACTLASALLVGGLLALLLFWAIPEALGVALPGDAIRTASIVSDSSRLKLWSHAWHLIIASPAWGVGPMHFAAIAYQNPVAAHPHNALLQLAAEWGLPMTILLLALIAGPAWQFVNRVRRVCSTPERQLFGYASPIMGAAVVSALSAAVVDSQVSGNLVMPGSQLWMALLVGWAIAWTRAQKTAAKNIQIVRNELNFPAWPLVLVASIFLVWGSWQAWSDWRHLGAVLSQGDRLVHNTKTNPRFWSDGWF